jgi:translocation and assembly module TamA
MPHRKPLTLAVLVGILLPASVQAELNLEGVDGELARNVLAFVALDDEPCDAEDWLIRRRFRALQTEARKALEPFGFYDPDIETQLEFGEDCWRAELTITPGEPVRYRHVDIRVGGAAASDSAFRDLPGRIAIQPGSSLRHADYDRLKRRLQTLAADRGYIEARFDAGRLDVWPNDGAADVTLHFDSGPRYRLGEIRIEQSFLDPAIARGYIDLEPGTLYDGANLARAHRDLSESMYFGSVEVSPDVDGASDERIPITIRLTPGSRIEYTVGVGASTDTGIRFRAGFRHNRLNRRGHRIISDLNASAVVQGITTEYRIPLKDPRREWFSITAGISREENDTFDEDAQRLGLRWTRIRNDEWLRTLSLDFSNDSFNVGEDVDTSRLIVPGITYDQKTADRDLFPANGRRLVFDLQGTDDVLGSTTSYLQASVRARWVRSFGTGNRLLARFTAGVTASKDFARLPPFVRFFAGGDESIRGFDYESLGPQDAAGNVIGGTNLLVGSLEYERHLRGNFYGAVFVDAGNAFDDTDFDAETGAGIGVKWRSPVGLVRLYLGYPVSADDGKIRVHVRLGADL